MVNKSPSLTVSSPFSSCPSKSYNTRALEIKIKIGIYTLQSLILCLNIHVHDHVHCRYTIKQSLCSFFSLNHCYVYDWMVHVFYLMQMGGPWDSLTPT